MIKDFRGVEIKVGSKVMYATRDSAYAYLHEAIVKEIVTKPDPWRKDQEETKLKVEKIASSDMWFGKEGHWHTTHKNVTITLKNVAVIG